MARQTWLAEAARATGYPVTEVPGWTSRGSSTFNPKGLVWHHTAGPSSGDMPSLHLLINGRSDLPGPLANYGLGRSGRIYVIAAGRANHAGLGGWAGLSGNNSVIGIEAEHTGRSYDPWPNVQLDAYRKLSAEILKRLDVGAHLMCGHKEWAPTRKIDPIRLHMPSERQRVQTLLEGGSMALTPHEESVVRRMVAELDALNSDGSFAKYTVLHLRNHPSSGSTVDDVARGRATTALDRINALLAKLRNV